MAAGLTLRANRYDEFCRVFEEVVQSLADENILSQTFLTDGSLDANEITLEQAQLLGNQVWGQGFAPPSFVDEFIVVRQQSMGANKQHIKAWLTKQNQVFEAMFWRCEDTLPEEIRVVYRPVVNEWRGNQELQLYIDYWEKA